MKQNAKVEFIKFSLVEDLFFAIFSITSYQTMFLQDSGMRSDQIGIIVATSSVVGLITVPIWGIISDRLHTARGTFLLSVVVTSILYCLLPLAKRITGGNVNIYYVYIPFIFLFRQATNSMLDSWCISELSPKGIGYGRVRMWGSVGYSLVSIILGCLVGVYFNADVAFYIILPLIIILLLIAPGKGKTTAVKDEPKEENKKKENYFKVLIKNRSFIFYLIYAFGLNIYLSVTLIFMSYILVAADCEPGQIGLVTGLRALVEISTMYLGARLMKKIPLRYIIIVPGILHGLEHLLYQTAGNIYGIIGIMILSGAAGGIFYSLGPTYIYEIVPREVSNTAQSLNAMNMTLVSITGSLVGGYVIKLWGIHTLTTGAGILILSLTVFFTITLIVKNKKRKEE